MHANRLESHPEGGSYQEVFRSAIIVTTPEGKRSAATHIYFSLAEGEVSRFHRVLGGDEIWNLYSGALRLIMADPAGRGAHEVIMSRDSGHFCEVVPAGHWQAAEPLEGKALVGCTVAPGFEFADFELLDSRMEQAAALVQQCAAWAKFCG